MTPKHHHEIEAAEVVLPCTELDRTLEFFTEQLGLAVEAIFPADDPAVAVVAGHGVRLRLQRDGAGAPGVLRLTCRDPAALAGGAMEFTAPNGTRIELAHADPLPVMPPLVPAFVLSGVGDAQWHTGRAGMRYRDLIPGRQGGRIIASHIHIPDGGPVPDYVHFHRVVFQLVYAYRGWARVVYEDQGPPFVLRAGDCVLQPPGIRHRVLESSPGLEVIEIAAPAEHETITDHRCELPTSATLPGRTYRGQRFVRHQAARASWRPWRLEEFEARDLGIADATAGFAAAHVVRRCSDSPPRALGHHAEIVFSFVLTGTATLRCEGEDEHPLAASSSFVVPAGRRYALARCSPDFEFLEVTLPA